jgi:hypothetical protein
MTELETYGPWAVIAGGSEGVGAVVTASAYHPGTPQAVQVNVDVLWRLRGEHRQAERDIRCGNPCSDAGRHVHGRPATELVDMHDVASVEHAQMNNSTGVDLQIV